MPINRRRKSDVMRIYPRKDGTFAMPATPGYDTIHPAPSLEHAIERQYKTRGQRRKRRPRTI